MRLLPAVRGLDVYQDPDAATVRQVTPAGVQRIIDAIVSTRILDGDNRRDRVHRRRDAVPRGTPHLAAHRAVTEIVEGTDVDTGYPYACVSGKEAAAVWRLLGGGYNSSSIPVVDATGAPTTVRIDVQLPGSTVIPARRRSEIRPSDGDVVTFRGPSTSGASDWKSRGVSIAPTWRPMNVKVRGRWEFVGDSYLCRTGYRRSGRQRGARATVPAADPDVALAWHRNSPWNWAHAWVPG